MNILVTGGSGFIGSNWIRKRLKEYPDDIICNIDKLTYAANVDTDFGGRRDLFDKEYFTWKEDYHPHRYHHWKCDICDEDKISKPFKNWEPDAVVHFAAESHVDNSIDDPSDFVKTNIVGTFNLLKYRSININ